MTSAPCWEKSTEMACFRAVADARTPLRVGNGRPPQGDRGAVSLVEG